jgi:adenylosuccinate synthase
VLLPAHALLDHARESALGEDKIGTTARGIGPAYEAKAARLGVRIGDLFCGAWKKQWPLQRARIAAELERHGAPADLGDLDALDAMVERWRDGLAPLVRDVNLELERALDAGESLLFEGAQGTLLDVDFGTYPFVTSSNGTSGGACTGSGVPPTVIDGVVGILKAYTTRVGAGPFPTELSSTEAGAPGERLRQRGNEFGTTTGRPRRCGWLDLVIARYARRINGVGSIALTKLDVLDQFDEIEVCMAYRLDGEQVRELPASLAALERAEPIYRTVRGWRESTVGALSFDQLPHRAQAYVELIEAEVGAPIELVSTGPRREETISRGGLLETWLGRPVEATV